MNSADYCRRTVIERVQAITSARDFPISTEEADDMCEILREKLGDYYPYATDEQIFATLIAKRL